MKIKEIRHSVQAVISTGAYENQREMFEVLATLKADENPEEAMRELEAFTHGRLELAVNNAKSLLIEKQYSGIRFYDIDGKKYPSVTSILSWNTEWKITQDELQQYASRGTIVHKLVEIFLTGGKWVEPEDVPELADDVTIVLSGSKGLHWNDCSYKAFFEKYGKDLKVLQMEQQCYNAEHGYAGRMDIYGEFQGKRSVIDIKTGATSDFRQLGAYSACTDGAEQLVIFPVGKTENKSGVMQPKITDNVQGEFEAFLVARKKFRERFGV